MTVNRYRNGEFAEVNQVGNPLEDATVKVRRGGEWDEIWPVTTVPDSDNLQLQYDLQQQPESDGELIEALIDHGPNESEAYNVGGPTMDSAGFNGEPIASLDGVDDGWLVDDGDWTDIMQPFTFYAAFDLDATGGDNILIATDGGDDPPINLGMQEGEWRIRCGESLYGSDNLDVNILSGVCDNTNGVLYEDGEQIAEGGIGDRNMDGGVSIGWYSDQNGWYFDGGVAEILVYSSAHDPETVADVNAYLTDRWGL